MSLNKDISITHQYHAYLMICYFKVEHQIKLYLIIKSLCETFLSLSKISIQINYPPPKLISTQILSLGCMCLVAQAILTTYMI